MENRPERRKGEREKERKERTKSRRCNQSQMTDSEPAVVGVRKRARGVRWSERVGVGRMCEEVSQVRCCVTNTGLWSRQREAELC